MEIECLGGCLAELRQPSLEVFVGHCFLGLLHLVRVDLHGKFGDYDGIHAGFHQDLVQFFGFPAAIKDSCGQALHFQPRARYGVRFVIGSSRGTPFDLRIRVASFAVCRQAARRHG